MTADRRVELEAGKLRLELSPALGGSIQAFTLAHQGAAWPILRNAVSSRNVLDASSFPLVPFVNRIRGGRFGFRGREIVLSPNMADDISPLHGQGWLNPWAVERASAGNAIFL